jgi:hypothetical protein
MFDALGQHALGESAGSESDPPPIYYPVSRIMAGGFSNTRPAQTATIYEVMLWDDGTPMLWDDGTPIFWDLVSEEDMPNRFAVVSSNYSTVTVADNAISANLTLDTELIDANAIVSLSGNTVVFAATDEWYDLELVVDVNVNSGSAVSADGYFNVLISNSGASDNVYQFTGTPSGSIVNNKDFTVHATIHMLSGETVFVVIENQTGHSLDAYVAGLTIVQR